MIVVDLDVARGTSQSIEFWQLLLLIPVSIVLFFVRHFFIIPHSPFEIRHILSSFCEQSFQAQ
ncbi:hypothetical protein BHT94_05025 [Bacillus licheniformis]|nr:hypothetical protein BHT94_05025 [Bacillus licheniformis]